MGYRSEVAITVQVEDYNNAPENVKDAFAETFGKPEPMNENDTMMIFHHDWIKWYDDDELVQTIETWLDTLNSDDYGMIRLGEDNDDTEYKGDPWNNGLEYTRKISF